jgi:hypothetical protein
MGCLFAKFSGRFPGIARFIVWIAKPALVGAAFTRSLSRCSASAQHGSARMRVVSEPRTG